MNKTHHNRLTSLRHPAHPAVHLATPRPVWTLAQLAAALPTVSSGPLTTPGGGTSQVDGPAVLSGLPSLNPSSGPANNPGPVEAAWVDPFDEEEYSLDIEEEFAFWHDS